MAALVVDATFDLPRLHAQLWHRLPEYARPLFLQDRASIELTGTFKLKKQELAREGYDPARTRDALFIDDRAQRAYVPLDAPLLARLRSGELRL